jgi:hypothetical protein
MPNTAIGGFVSSLFSAGGTAAAAGETAAGVAGGTAGVAGGTAGAAAGSSLASTLGAAASAASAGLAISNALNQPKAPPKPTVPNQIALPNPVTEQQQMTTLAAQQMNMSGRQSTLLTQPLGSGGGTTLGG